MYLDNWYRIINVGMICHKGAEDIKLLGGSRPVEFFFSVNS